VIPANVQVALCGRTQRIRHLGAPQSPAGRSSMKAPFEFDKLIPVFVGAGSAGRAQSDQHPVGTVCPGSDRGEGRKATVARLHGSILSWPKFRWSVQVEVLDEQDRRLDMRSRDLESAGFITSDPAISPVDLDFVLDEGACTEAKSFRVSIVKPGGRSE